MDDRILGRSDLRVSSIGLGCATFGREIDEAASFAVMDRAWEAGINFFDTAAAYGLPPGRSEEIVGQWLAARGVRDRIVLATKVQLPLTRAHVLASAEASLRRLRVDAVDLFQLHAWDGDTPLEETLEACATLVRTGKARTIGCSNFAGWQLMKALWLQDVNGWPRLESVQSNYNLVVREIEQEVLPCCADRQIGVITYSPLGAGFLTGKHRRDAVVQGSRMDFVPQMIPIYFHETGFRVVERLRGRAAALGVPMALLALAWAMSEPRVTSVLIGARSPEQVEQALAADAMGMSAELRAELSAL